MSHIRLSTLATTSLAILLIGTSCGAQTPAPEPPIEVLIFGDVEKSGIFEVLDPISAADFVSRAKGLSAGTANVRVVRGGFGNAKVVWGDYVSKGQACDFHVAHGDMLVVHSLQRLSGDANASKSIEVAVINSETRPLIVKLSPGQARVVDVLKELQMSDREFMIVRTNPKAVPVNPTADTILEHGDLLMVGNAAAVRAAPLARVTQAGGQQTTMVPAHVPNSAGPLLIPVSEQTVTQSDAAPMGEAAPMDDSEPIPVEANYGALSVPGPEMRPAPGQGISSPQPPAGYVPSPGGEMRDALNTDPWLLGAPPNAPSSDSGSPQPVDDIPPFNGNQSAYNGNGSNYPGGYDSRPQNGYGTNQYPSGMPGAEPGTGLPPKPVEEPADAAAAQALPLPGELDAAVVQDDSSNSTMWYVAGLAGALLLVLGAWVYGSRAMSESPQARVDPYKRPVNRQHSNTVKYPPVAAAPSPGGNVSAAPVADKPRAPTIKPIKPITAAAPVVAAAAAQVTQGVSPVVSAMPKPQTRPVVANPPVQQPVPAPVINTPVPAAPVAAAPAIQVPAPAAPAPVVQVPVEPAPAMPAFTAPAVVREPAPSRPAVAPVAAIDPEPIPVPPTSTTRILDALINNSLPVSEQPVQLPVNLEFFGDSSGPKQLRIDPAQPALRGPHTGLRAGQEQRSDARSSAAYDS